MRARHAARHWTASNAVSRSWLSPLAIGLSKQVAMARIHEEAVRLVQQLAQKAHILPLEGQPKLELDLNELSKQSQASVQD